MRGCSIPQAWSQRGPHNVVRGDFLRRGQLDWAVLCSRRGRSAILVYPQGGRRPIRPLAEMDDAAWLQTVSGKSRIGFSRIISAAGRDEIQRYQAAFGGPLPKRIDHPGIEDYFEGKASTIHYFAHGRWLELTGMD